MVAVRIWALTGTRPRHYRPRSSRDVVDDALTMAGLEAAKARGRTGGRPPAMNQADITAAKAMLRANGISVVEVAERLRVSPSTLYRHLPGGRGALV